MPHNNGSQMNLKPPLIYTIQRSGTHFIAHCFNYLFDRPIVTHNKNKKHTTGESINYKDYKVFATIREPKEIIISELTIIYENGETIFHEESLIKKIDELLNIQEIYFNDLINNKDFYIMPFKIFTNDTKKFFIRLARENNFLSKQRETIRIDLFFKTPLEHILKYSKEDQRYPRKNNIKVKDQIEELVEKLSLLGYFDYVNSLYQILEERYFNGQISIEI